MKWINYFFNFNIPFYIYKLKIGDSIIENKNHTYDRSIIILYGTIYLTQIFSNQEILPITILNTNNIININNSSINTKSYYKMTALQEAYLISFSDKNITINKNVSTQFLKYYLTNYKLTLYNQKMINYILIQKSTQHKIIQLLLFLSIQSGIIHNKFIKIPFKVRKRDIAIMIGSNINTINRTFKLLERKKIVYYSKNNLLLIHNSLFVHFIYLLS